MIKRCEICKKEFETKNSFRQCCSRSCSAKMHAINFKKDKRYDESCKKRSDSMQKRWNNERDRIIKSMRDGYSNPIAKENVSKNKKAFWEKPENHEKMFISKYRKYMMPSGRIINIQGYEDLALDILLKKYKETDLLVTPTEINKKTGIIRYTGIDGRIHSYCPDFFILSENKIIEVKSQYTYNQHLETNLIKRKACLDNGFQFDFMILEKCR